MTLKSVPAQRVKTGQTIVMSGWNPRTSAHSTEYFVTGVTKSDGIIEFETVPEGGTNDGFGVYRFTTAAKGRRLTIKAA